MTTRSPARILALFFGVLCVLFAETVTADTFRTITHFIEDGYEKLVENENEDSLTAFRSAKDEIEQLITLFKKKASTIEYKERKAFGDVPPASTINTERITSTDTDLVACRKYMQNAIDNLEYDNYDGMLAPLTNTLVIVEKVLHVAEKRIAKENERTQGLYEQFNMLSNRIEVLSNDVFALQEANDETMARYTQSQKRTTNIESQLRAVSNDITNIYREMSSVVAQIEGYASDLSTYRAAFSEISNRLLALSNIAGTGGGGDYTSEFSLLGTTLSNLNDTIARVESTNAYYLTVLYDYSNSFREREKRLSTLSNYYEERITRMQDTIDQNEEDAAIREQLTRVETRLTNNDASQAVDALRGQVSSLYNELTKVTTNKGGSDITALKESVGALEKQIAKQGGSTDKRTIREVRKSIRNVEKKLSVVQRGEASETVATLQTNIQALREDLAKVNEMYRSLARDEQEGAPDTANGMGKQLELIFIVLVVLAALACIAGIIVLIVYIRFRRANASDAPNVNMAFLDSYIKAERDTKRDKKGR